MDSQKIKIFLNEAFHNPYSGKAHIVNGFLSFLIMSSVAIVPLHFLPDLEWIFDELFFFDRMVVTLFTVEYILRIWSAKRPMRYVSSWWGIIDLVAILPFYLAKMGILANPEVFLMLRFIRILKFVRTYEMQEASQKMTQLNHHGDFELLPRERIDTIVHKHGLVFLLGMILPLFFTTAALAIIIVFRGNSLAVAISILFLFFAGIFFLKAWLDYNYDVIYITNYRVIVQNRELFGTIKNDVSYESITNVVPSNLGLFRWLFGIGDIHIETAAMAGTLFFPNSPQPHKVVRRISANRQRIITARENVEEREVEIIDKLRERTDLEHPIKEEKKSD